jgi:hypothetical protein
MALTVQHASSSRQILKLTLPSSVRGMIAALPPADAFGVSVSDIVSSITRDRVVSDESKRNNGKGRVLCSDASRFDAS